MEYNKIIAVTGLPGLFELVSSKSDGAIVRSLEDGSTKFASSRIHNFSHLESIEIYTVRDNVNLVDIFQSMDKNGGALPDVKDNAAVKRYFESAYPDMDFERVYASDMKKMVKWFSILKKNNVEIKLSELPEEEPVVEEQPQPATEEAKPAKKTAKKKEEATAPAEETPKKKVTRNPPAGRAGKKEE